MLKAIWLNNVGLECGRTYGRDKDDIRRVIISSLCKGEAWEKFGETGDTIILENSATENMESKKSLYDEMHHGKIIRKWFAKERLKRYRIKKHLFKSVFVSVGAISLIMFAMVIVRNDFKKK